MKSILCLLLFSLMACQKDHFVQDVKPGADPRFSKSYKMGTATSESYAVDIDILWVIDNSGSMGSYQADVAANSDLFIQQFTANSRLQWKLGLISTDESDPPYLGFDWDVDYKTSDAVRQFNDAVGRLGTSGSSIEKSFQPTLNVLSRYPGWMRPGAYLVLIFVSDELEQSSVNTAQFMSQLKAKIGGDISRLIAYGVYSSGSNDPWNKKYDEIVKLTNGKTFSLSDPDYGKLLSDLGKDLVKKVTTIYPIVLLDQKPIRKTLEVRYKKRLLAPGTDWIYNSTYNYIEIRNMGILDNKDPNLEVSFQIDHS